MGADLTPGALKAKNRDIELEGVEVAIGDPQVNVTVPMKWSVRTHRGHLVGGEPLVARTKRTGLAALRGVRRPREIVRTLTARVRDDRLVAPQGGRGGSPTWVLTANREGPWAQRSTSIRRRL